ncbi:hypothetical protein PFISCL1PPCAC_7051, partial [Pristionchus fissidentatus]
LHLLQKAVVQLLQPHLPDHRSLDWSRAQRRHSMSSRASAQPAPCPGPPRARRFQSYTSACAPSAPCRRLVSTPRHPR